MPGWADRPRLLPWLAWIWAAWTELDFSRPRAFGAVGGSVELPITQVEIDAWARNHGVVDAWKRTLLASCIVAMEAAAAETRSDLRSETSESEQTKDDADAGEHPTRA